MFKLALLTYFLVVQVESNFIKNLLKTPIFTLFVGENTLKSLLYKLPKDNSKEYETTDNKINEFGDYDFIIVGAGSSGTVIANRLSENSNWTILVLEAGQPSNEFTRILRFQPFYVNSDKNWGYFTSSQTHGCQGMKDHQCFLPTGKSLGGTSTLNGGQYVRGNKEDFNSWSKYGAEGWTYDDVLPYFIKSEHCSISGVDAGYHGFDGLLNVDYSIPPSKYYDTFTQAMKELNYEYVDYNGRNQMGYSLRQINIKHGRKVLASDAFIRPIERRQNLKITTGAFVTKILVDETSLEANGVEFIYNKRRFKASARLEVVLAAGAINTPQLLMLSGIGPKEELNKHNINVIKALPQVGRNLRDHTNYYLMFSVNDTAKLELFPVVLYQYLNGTGSLTRNDDAVLFVNTQNKSSIVPNIEIALFPPINLGPVPPKAERTYNYNEFLFKEYIRKLDLSKTLQFFVTLLHPKSKGTLTLKSSSSKDFPVIDPDYFSDEDDVMQMYEGIKTVFDIVETEAFKAIDAKWIVPPICKEHKAKTNAFWDCLIRNLSASVYHPIGTVRMGRNKDNSVVNSKLLVHGIKKLRIANAGVIPTHIAGHPAAAAMMIGERVSDFIKNNYGLFD